MLDYDDDHDTDHDTGDDAADADVMIHKDNHPPTFIQHPN